MAKNPSFRPDFGPYGLNLEPKNFFCRFYHCWMLDIVASYHWMQFQGKLMNQTWENGKKPTIFGFDFGANLGHQNFVSNIWFYQSLDIMVWYHHVQYPKKLMIQSWGNLVTDRWTDRQREGKMNRWTEWFRSTLYNSCQASKKKLLSILLTIIHTLF